MTACTLCGAPIGATPVTSEGVPGQYCCEGCLSAARNLEEEVATDNGKIETPAPGNDAGIETTVVAVDGMHCTTCEAFLESQAQTLDGVVGVDATYAAELVRVRHDPDTVSTADIVAALTGSGYQAREAGTDDSGTGETYIGRLLVGGLFTAMAMMWYVLFLYPVYLGVPPEDLLLNVDGPAGTYILGMVWVFATTVLGYTGRPLFRSAVVSLRARRPNVDLLVALAAGTAYVYSSVAVLAGRTEVYFDVAMVIVVVVTLGRYYETRMRRRASDALSTLAAASVDSARRKTKTGVESVPIDTLDTGDEVLVRPGERIPIDGTILDGVAAVDESLVTGEAAPSRKEPGDEVIGGSVATDGRLVITPTAAGKSTVDRLVDLLWDVQSQRSGPQRVADRIATVFVPAVVAIAIATTVISMLSGTAFTPALLTGLAVLVVSCPCALGLATPLAVASGLHTALDAGVVITDRAAMERTPGVDVIALDKTGTLTTGSMTVVDVYGRESVLERAGAVEQFADHPIAEAIAATAPGTPSVEEVTRYPGMGAAGIVAGETVVVGRAELIDEHDISVPTMLEARYEYANSDGYTASYVAWKGEVRGVIVTGDEYRGGWREVITELAVGADRVVVLTGDNDAAATRLETHSQIDEVFSEVPPSEKATVIDQLRERGTVAFVGDGTNDAPGLATADVGITMGSGTEIAGDAADAVVVGNDLRAVPMVFAVTTATRRRIRENLAWAFGYNAVAIPLAAVGLLNPLVAAVAMSASSLLVVGNSARSLLEDGPTPVSNRDDAGTTDDRQDTSVGQGDSTERAEKPVHDRERPGVSPT